MNKLVDMIDKTREPWFVCLGTPLSYADGLAPRIGSRLESKYKVTGTVEKPVDNKTLLDEKSFVYDIDKEKYQVVSIDISINKSEDRDEDGLYIREGINPAKGNIKGNDHKTIGEIGIIIGIEDIVPEFQLLLSTTDIFGGKLDVIEDKVVKIIKDLF